MSQKNKRALLADAILNMEEAAPAATQTSQGIVATALDMHREGLKERLAALEKSAAEARARGDWLEAIPPDLIDDPLPADRDRRFLQDTVLDELTRSIEVNGQHVPILVRRHPALDGRFEIAAGRRRLEVCKRLQKPVLSRVLTLGDEAMLDLQYRENAERADVTIFERAHWFLQVQERLQASTTALAKRFELSQPMMVEYLKMARLPERLIAVLDDPRELTIAQTKKLHAALTSRRDAELILINSIENGPKGQGTGSQITRALAQLSAPKSKPKTRTVTDKEGRALLTLTQSGRQTVFRFAPGMDERLIERLADSVPDLIDQWKER